MYRIIHFLEAFDSCLVSGRCLWIAFLPYSKYNAVRRIFCYAYIAQPPPVPVPHIGLVTWKFQGLP